MYALLFLACGFLTRVGGRRGSVSAPQAAQHSNQPAPLVLAVGSCTVRSCGRSRIRRRLRSGCVAANRSAAGRHCLDGCCVAG